MGLLNTYFLANDDRDAERRAAAVGGPAGGVQSGGLTPLELDTLLAIVSGVSYEDLAVEPVRFLGEPGEEWLFEVRPPLVGALAGLDEAGAQDAANEWVRTDELQMGGWETSGAAALIGELATIASEATHSDRRLYGWGSL
jgi:hypothetical protein